MKCLQILLVIIAAVLFVWACIPAIWPDEQIVRFIVGVVCLIAARALYDLRGKMPVFVQELACSFCWMTFCGTVLVLFLAVYIDHSLFVMGISLGGFSCSMRCLY